MKIFDYIFSVFSVFKKNPREEREKKVMKQCGNICYCKCSNILNDNSTCEMINKEGIYKYTCNDCGDISIFHFGIAPVPIKLDSKNYIF